jgi:hypothetical protein
MPAPERMICSQETRTIYAPDISKYSALRVMMKAPGPLSPSVTAVVVTLPEVPG